MNWQNPMTPEEPTAAQRMQGDRVKVTVIPQMPELEQIKQDGRRWSTDGAIILAYEQMRGPLMGLTGLAQHQWLCRTPKGNFFMFLAAGRAKNTRFDVTGGSVENDWEWQGLNINPIAPEWAMGAWFDMTVKAIAEFGEAFPGRVLEDA